MIALRSVSSALSSFVNLSYSSSVSFSKTAEDFENANNYIAVVGKNTPDLDEKAGYYGEKVVLKAQELGLNTCWAAMGKGRGKEKIGEGEREVIIISLGYGRTQGSAHRSKKAEKVSNLSTESPEWFQKGVEAALLAPTAMNQQRFYLRQEGNTVKAEIPKIGVFLKLDLGIVKCHFELGSSEALSDVNFTWR